MLRAQTGCRAHLSLVIGGFMLITRVKSTWRAKTVEQRLRALLSLIINGFERNWVWTWNGWCWKRLSSALVSDHRWIRAHYERMKAVERSWVWSETASSTTESGPGMLQAQRYLESDFRRIRAHYERRETVERTWIWFDRTWVWSTADSSTLRARYDCRAHLNLIIGGFELLWVWTETDLSTLESDRRRSWARFERKETVERAWMLS